MDAGFIEEIKALGGQTVTRCFQCGSCTATCPFTSEVEAFPRRTIRFVQLGLRARALGSPDMWLCSPCNLCKLACPREADPSEVMHALARYASSKYGWPSFTRHLTMSPKLAVPVLGMITAALLASIYFVSRMSSYASSVDFEAFLPTFYVDTAGIAVGAITAVGIGINGLRLWRLIDKRSDSLPSYSVRKRIKYMLRILVQEAAFQRRIRTCNTGRLQWIAHMSIIAGFAGAAVTTTLVFILGAADSPFPLDHPVKVLGNISAGLLVFGGTVAIVRRAFLKRSVGTSSFYDGLFLSLLFSVAVTGILSELARLGDIAILAYPSYSIHLVSAALLLSLAPYTKFAHAIYRPLAMYLAKLRGWSN